MNSHRNMVSAWARPAHSDLTASAPDVRSHEHSDRLDPPSTLALCSHRNRRHRIVGRIVHDIGGRFGNGRRCGHLRSYDGRYHRGGRDGVDTGEALIDEPDDGDGGAEEVDDLSTFRLEVWADNWFAVYVDGELIGEDSVPITTERSFNAETFTFEATYPFTIAIEAKDFKETDSGIEYIGEAQPADGRRRPDRPDHRRRDRRGGGRDERRLVDARRPPGTAEHRVRRRRRPRRHVRVRDHRGADRLGRAADFDDAAGRPPPSGAQPTSSRRTATTRSPGTTRRNWSGDRTSRSTTRSSLG